jgi:hypothetical protein
MRSVILMVEKKHAESGSQENVGRWREFCNTIAKLGGNNAVEALSPTIWQIDFYKSPAAFGLLIYACEEFEYDYRLLAFEEEPHWIRGTVNFRAVRPGR